MTKLDEIVVVPLEIKIGDKVYPLKEVSLSDHAWIESEIPEKEYQNLFRDISTPESSKNVLRIIYHQLMDKKDFAPREIVDFDEDGNEVVEKIGGIKLFRSMLSSAQLTDLVYLFYELFYRSNPEEDAESKKKFKHVIKKQEAHVKRVMELTKGNVK